MALLTTLLLLMAGSAVSAGISAAANYGMQKDSQKWSSSENDLSRQFTSSENQAARQFSSEEAQKQRDWATEMDNTKYQRQVEDMKAAGLNVGALGASPGGSPGGSTASSPMSGTASMTGAHGLSSGVSPAALMSAVSSVVSNNYPEFKTAFIANSTKSAQKAAKAIKEDLNGNDIYSFGQKMWNKYF